MDRFLDAPIKYNMCQILPIGTILTFSFVIYSSTKNVIFAMKITIITYILKSTTKVGTYLYKIKKEVMIFVGKYYDKTIFKLK